MRRIARLSLLLLCFSLILSVSDAFVESLKGKITFWSRDENHKYGVYIMDADGSNATKIMDGANPLWLQPSIHLSPDCKKVVFVKGDFNDPDIAIWEIASNRSLNLTNDKPRLCSDPHWAPNGKCIVFCSYEKPGGEIFIINSDGIGLKMIGEGTMPDWSLDGRRIAFVKGRKDICTINADSGNLRNITKGMLNIETIISMRWSPNSRQILFAAYVFKDNKAQIYIMDLDGSNLKLIMEDVRTVSCCWSPDGSKIAMDALIEQNNDNKRHIWVMDPDGRNLERLTNSDSEEWLTDWRDPDYSQIGVSPQGKIATTWSYIKCNT